MFFSWFDLVHVHFRNLILTCNMYTPGSFKTEHGVFDELFWEIRQVTSSLLLYLTLSVENWVSNLKFQTLRIETWVTVNVLLSSILCYIDSISRSTIHWLRTKSKISFLNSLLYWYLWKSQKLMSYFFNTDDLPLRGFIGHLEEGSFLPHTHKVFLWAHLNFNIAYNGDQVMKTWQGLRKQNWIPAWPLGRQLSHFTCLVPLFSLLMV